MGLPVFLFNENGCFGHLLQEKRKQYKHTLTNLDFARKVKKGKWVCTVSAAGPCGMGVGVGKNADSDNQGYGYIQVGSDC